MEVMIIMIPCIPCTRRQFVAAAMGTSALFILPEVLAACSNSKTASAAPANSSLTVLMPVAPIGADYDGPQNANPSLQELVSQTYRGLIDYVTVNNDGVLAPQYGQFKGELASSLHQNGLEWTVTLRQGVISPYGNELTADDVVWTFARAKSVSGAVACGWFLGNVASLFTTAPIMPNATAQDKALHGEVVKVDKYTVKFTQYETNELFPAVLAVYCTWIFDSTEAMKHATTADPWAHNWTNTQGTAGFGPYKITSWTSGVEVMLSAVPQDVLSNPYFKTIRVLGIPSDSSRISSLLSGQADVITGLSPQEFSKVAQNDQVKVYSWFGNEYLALGLNYKIEPWSAGGNAQIQRLIRQAVAYAIPYDQIISQGYFGFARKWNGLITTGFVGAKEYPGKYTTNIDKAKQLLAEAGFPGGKGLSGPGLSLTYVAELEDIYQPIATFTQTGLQKIGINVQLNPIPQAQFSDRYSTKLDLPMYFDQNVSIVADAGYMTQLYFIPNTDGGLVNSENYDNPEVIALYQKQRTETGASRIAMLYQIQDILMDDLPEIPIAELPDQVAVRKGITDYSPRLEKADNMDAYNTQST
jgi:peptide/nickel transport system substrate-binding protein